MYNTRYRAMDPCPEVRDIEEKCKCVCMCVHMCMHVCVESAWEASISPKLAATFHLPSPVLPPCPSTMPIYVGNT